jgi:hypothetical protein
MDMIARLEALASGPKPWLVTTTYEDGRVRTLRQPMEVQARNYAEREGRRIGVDLIDRDTGNTVRIKSVTVEYVA